MTVPWIATHVPAPARRWWDGDSVVVPSIWQKLYRDGVLYDVTLKGVYDGNAIQNVILKGYSPDGAVILPLKTG